MLKHDKLAGAIYLTPYFLAFSCVLLVVNGGGYLCGNETVVSLSACYCRFTLFVQLCRHYDLIWNNWDLS